MSGTASLLFPNEDLGGPLDPNSPEGKAYLAQRHAEAVGASSLLPGLASLVLPGQSSDGSVGWKQLVPGALPQAYNFLSGLKHLSGTIMQPLTGEPATGLPGSDVSEQLAKDSLASANHVIPHMEPTNDLDKSAADMGTAAGQMGPFGLGGGLVKGLPTAAKTAIELAAPAMESSAAAPVAAAITGGVGGVLGAVPPSGSALPPQTPDMTNQYNTPLNPQETQQYAAWLQSKGINPNTAAFDYDMQGAFKAGVLQSGNGHFPDTFKKPNHTTFSDQSQYNGADGYQGGSWVDNGNNTYTFNASPTNVQMTDPTSLQQYFATREQGNTLNLPLPIPPIPPGPVDITHMMKPIDITDTLQPQPLPGLQGDQDSELTLGKAAMYGAAAIAVVAGGPRALKFVDELAGGVRQRWYQGDADLYNAAETALKQGVADAPHVEAPLPVGVGGVGNRVNTAVANSNARMQAYTDAIATNKTEADQMRAETGLVNNASAFNGRVADVATTGLDKTSGIQMPSIVDHWQRVADFTPAQTDAFNKARFYADELDNRTKLFSQAVATKPTAPGALNDANFRVNFPYTDSADLRSQVAASRADPVVAAELDTINQIHRQLMQVAQSSDLISTSEMRSMQNDHPNYLASANTDGTLQGAFGPRDTPIGGGLDNIPIHASELDKQHFTDLYRSIENNSWTRNIVDKSIAYQDTNPSVAQIFLPNRTPNGGWAKPSAEGDTLSFRRNGETENYKVGNTALLRDMTASSQQSGTIMGAMNYARNIFQSAVTGPLAALTGHFFPAVNAVRNTLLASTFRPEGTTYGPLTSLISNATGGAVNPRGLLPDAALGTVQGLMQGLGAEGAKAVASMLDRANPNAVIRMLDASVGPAFTDAVHSRMAAAWDTSIRAEMKANGALGSTGYAATELPAKQMGAAQWQSSPLNNLVPKLFRVNGPLGNAQPMFVKMQSLYHEMQSIVNEAAQTHFYSTNKGRVSDEVLTHETRQLTGDPGTHGGAPLMRGITQAVPYSNIIIQDLARMGRSFAETPLSTAYGVISALGSLALGSAYTAKLSGNAATQHLTGELSNDQHAARVHFYIPGVAPEASPYIDLPQRVRWMYPMFLQAAHDGLNMQADPHNPVGASDALDWLHSYFNKHVTNSTMASTLAGASDALSPGLPSPAQASFNLAGRNVAPTIYNQVMPGETGNMPIGGDSSAPGHLKGSDPLTGSLGGSRLSHAVASMFGIAGSSIMSALTSIKANEKAHNDPMTTATVIGDQWLDRLKDSVPFARGTVFSNNSALAAKSPLIERTEAALDAMRPTRTWKTDAKYGPTDTSNGYTRARGQLLQTAPLNDPSVPKDPTMARLYDTYGAYTSFIEKKMMPPISDIRKQMNALTGSPADPETIRTQHNAYQRQLQTKYEQLAGIINDADASASRIVGKPVSIMKMDWSKGPEQFQSQVAPQ